MNDTQSQKEERWRPALGWEGLYEVSNHGRVRSVARWVDARKGRRLAEGRLLRANVGSAGYATVMLCDGVRRKYPSVHRLVAEAWCFGEGEVVRHLDGNPSNNSADNLAWGSYSDNESDKDRHGRRRKGLDHPMCRIDEGTVRTIRASFARGLSQLAIAKETGINRGTVGKIVRGESFQEVQ